MAIDFEAEKKKRRKSNKEQAAKWNKANKQKVSSTGSLIKANPSTSGKNRKPGQSAKPKKKQMTAAAKAYQNKALTDYAFTRAMLGVQDGLMASTVGIKMTDNMDINHKKLKKSKAYTGGNIAGTVVGYGAGYGGVSKVTGKLAAKTVASKAGKKVVSKAAKTQLAKAAARKTLTKAGQNATKKAVEHAAKKQVSSVAKGLVKGAAADATAGTLMNSNSARAEGMKVGSKEWKKYMAENAAMDFVTGGVIEAAPLVVRAASKGGSKTIPKVVNGKVKNVKVSNAEYNKMVKAAKGAADDIDISDVTKTKKLAPAPKSANQARNAMANTRLVKEDLGDYLNTGTKHSIKKNKQKMSVMGDSPILTSEKEVNRYISDSVMGKTSNNIKSYGKVGNRFANDVLKQTNGEVNIKNMYLELSSDDIRHSYKGHANPKQTGDIPLKLEDYKKIPEYIDNYDDVIEVVKTKNGTRIILGKKINGHTIITELVPDSRNSVKFKNMWGVDTDKYAKEIEKRRLQYQATSNAMKRETSYLSAEKPSNDIITESVDNVNGRFISAQQKDLGADVYRPSTQEINTDIYGQDQGVVNATPYGETSQTAKTLYNSPMLNETSQKIIRENINDGIYAKYTKSNKTAIDNAIAAVDKDMAKAQQNFDFVADNGRAATSEDIATGYRLAQNYQQMGDYDSMMKVLADVASMESEAGRTLQAMRMFSNLTPEAKAISVGKQINRIQKSTGTAVNPPTELIEQLSRAADEATANRLQKEIMRDVWSQIPASWTQKANAWRYMSMLANPKTHIRNILGNALFVPIKGMRNIIASGLEKAIVKDGNRSKAVLTIGDSNLVSAGKKDFEQIKDALMNGGSRYIESGRSLDAAVYKNKALEWVRKKSGDLLEKEDEVFMGYAYRRSYAQYLKANGVKNTVDVSAEMLNKARNYAINEAMNSTYRDASALADYLANMKKYANVPLDQVPGDTTGEKLVKKTGSMLVEATVPFTKTPINIMRRGWDYSPGGLIQGMGKILKAGGDNAKLIDGIAKVSSGLTGTGIVGLGLYMGMHDMAQGSLDTTTAAGAYAAQNGEQEYSIKIGDYSYTMDWAAPISMPFFIGVELGNDFAKDGFSFASVMSSMKGMTDPIFNLSMLSGLNTALDTAFDDNATLGVLGNIAESYVGQYFPTLGSQIAKTLTPEKRTTISTAENKDVRDNEKFINQIKNKIPGLTDTNQPYVDLWGQTEKKSTADDYIKAAFDNFINPGTLKSTKQSSVDKELNRLGDKLGDMSEIVPRKAQSSEYDQKFGNETYHMSEADLTAYNKAKGQYAQSELKKLFATKKYQNLSAEEKKKAIKEVYDNAKDNARMEFLMKQGVTKEEYKVSQMGKNQKKAYKASGMDIDEFEKLYKAKKTVTDTDGTLTSTMKYISGGATNYKQANAIAGGTLSERSYQNAQNLYNLGLKPKDITKIANGADTDGNKHYSTAELVAYLNKTNYSNYEKAYIFQALASWNARNPYI